MGRIFKVKILTSFSIFLYSVHTLLLFLSFFYYCLLLLFCLKKENEHREEIFSNLMSKLR